MGADRAGHVRVRTGKDQFDTPADERHPRQSVSGGRLIEGLFALLTHPGIRLSVLPLGFGGWPVPSGAVGVRIGQLAQPYSLEDDLEPPLAAQVVLLGVPGLMHCGFNGVHRPSDWLQVPHPLPGAE